MHLKISRGEEARKVLVRYGHALEMLKASEDAQESFNKMNPFPGGGAYADAAWENNPDRVFLRGKTAENKKYVEDFERELKELAASLIEDWRQGKNEPQVEEKVELGSYMIKYPFDIDRDIVERFLETLDGSTPTEMRAISMKFENPLVIENLLRKLFSQERTHKGRVFGYAVVCNERDPGQQTVIVSDETTIKEEVLAILPISSHAKQNAVMFARANNISSLFLQKFLECREELDRRDKRDTYK